MKTTLSIRLDDAQLAQVAKLAEKFGVKDVDVIRWGVTALIKYVEKHGGNLHLPIDFETLWSAVQVAAPRQIAALDPPSDVRLNEPRGKSKREA